MKKTQNEQEEEELKLIENLMKLLQAHRRVFRQERTYRRGVGMVLGR